MNTSIREAFHKLGNIHNNISIIAGFGEELINDAFFKNDEQQLKKVARVRECLQDIVKKIQEADKKADKVKKYIYKNMDPDKKIKL